MAKIFSFPPIVNNQSQILILGSMPGVVSLRANQYYAHPRNLFWKIMSDLLQFDSQSPYNEKIAQLLNAKIALWDVLKSCERKGSLDSEIDRKTIVVNEFEIFFTNYPQIQAIFFNGGKAEDCFKRYVSKNITPSGVILKKLPSTSPAHATKTLEQKIYIWKEILNQF